MLYLNKIESISLLMINGNIENFYGHSIIGLMESINADGTWEKQALVLDTNGMIERIIYTKFVESVKINYKNDI